MGSISMQWPRFMYNGLSGKQQFSFPHFIFNTAVKTFKLEP